MKSKHYPMISNVEQLFDAIYVMIVPILVKKKQWNVRCPLFHYDEYFCIGVPLEIVKKYSNFVSAPIYINDTRVNNLRVSVLSVSRMLTEQVE